MTSLTIADPLPLPCGALLPNRLCKAAMTEGLADPHNRATPELEKLYGVWSDGGAGLLITGNVQIDRTHLERPGNIAIDNNGGLDALRRMAKAGRRAGNHLWMQINHPGRQTERRINPTPSAPSAVPLQAEGDFGHPRALLESEITDIIRRFAHAAVVARNTGFSGIQIHAAHGYLLSQFLSPRSNHREDDWGGPLANRARLLLEVVRAIRKGVGADFPIGVKLNSSDFQQGGFDLTEAAEVAGWLSDEKIDLLELSGGNYERQSMGGADTPAESTKRREAHFLDFAHQIRPASKSPVMVTGGFRTLSAMNAAIQSGDTDVIGIGGPFCLEPDLAHNLISGKTDAAWLNHQRLMDMSRPSKPVDMKMITALGSSIFAQIISLGRSGKIRPGLTFDEALPEFLEFETTCFDNLER